MSSVCTVFPRSIIALFAMAAFTSCAHIARTPSQLRLYAMNCGHIHVDDAKMFSDEHVYDGQRREGVVPCYLIRHPRGDLIWDAGLSEGMADVPGGVNLPEAQAHMIVEKKLTVIRQHVPEDFTSLPAFPQALH